MKWKDFLKDKTTKLTKLTQKKKKTQILRGFY